MSIALDYIHAIAPQTLRDAGATQVFRYLSYQGQDSLGKIIHKAEYDALTSAGIVVNLNWEFDSRDWMGGASAGAFHGQEAVRQAKALGYPSGRPIIGSCDFDITKNQWDIAGSAYAKAFAKAVANGGYRAGVYGPWDVLTWCTDIMAVFWQAGMSTDWSQKRNQNKHPLANWRQRGHKTVAGQDTDWSDILSTVEVNVSDAYDLLKRALNGFEDLGSPNENRVAEWVQQGQSERKQLLSKMDTLESKVDALVAPTVPTAAEVAAELIKQLKG